MGKGGAGKRKGGGNGGAGKGMGCRERKVDGKRMQVQGKGEEKGRGCRGFKGIHGKGCTSKERGAGKEGGTRKAVSWVSRLPPPPQKGLIKRDFDVKTF